MIAPDAYRAPCTHDLGAPSRTSRAAAGSKPGGSHTRLPSYWFKLVSCWTDHLRHSAIAAVVADSKRGDGRRQRRQRQGGGGDWEAVPGAAGGPQTRPAAHLIAVTPGVARWVREGAASRASGLEGARTRAGGY